MLLMPSWVARGIGNDDHILPDAHIKQDRSKLIDVRALRSPKIDEKNGV